MINKGWRVWYKGQIVEQGHSGTLPANGKTVEIPQEDVSIKFGMYDVGSNFAAKGVSERWRYDMFLSAPNFEQSTGLCNDIPTTTDAPTFAPTPAPTLDPTAAPTHAPTPAPTNSPTLKPTAAPTPSPTNQPTEAPTPYPTPDPTAVPTPDPTAAPTPFPTEPPTPAPTNPPTVAPTGMPTSPAADLTTNTQVQYEDAVAACSSLSGKTQWHNCVADARLLDSVPMLPDVVMMTTATQNMEDEFNTMTALKRASGAAINGDPIIQGLAGQVFRFDGRNGAWYSAVSAPSFQCSCAINVSLLLFAKFARISHRILRIQGI